MQRTRTHTTKQQKHEETTHNTSTIVRQIKMHQGHQMQQGLFILLLFLLLIFVFPYGHHDTEKVTQTSSSLVCFPTRSPSASSLLQPPVLAFMLQPSKHDRDIVEHTEFGCKTLPCQLGSSLVNSQQNYQGQHFFSFFSFPARTSKKRTSKTFQGIRLIWSSLSQPHV